jgi:hypothetical protein
MKRVNWVMFVVISSESMIMCGCVSGHSPSLFSVHVENHSHEDSVIGLDRPNLGYCYNPMASHLPLCRR